MKNFLKWSQTFLLVFAILIDDPPDQALFGKEDLVLPFGCQKVLCDFPCDTHYNIHFKRIVH